MGVRLTRPCNRIAAVYTRQVLTCRSKLLGHAGAFEHGAEVTINLSLSLNGGGKKKKGGRPRFMTAEDEEVGVLRSPG